VARFHDRRPTALRVLIELGASLFISRYHFPIRYRRILIVMLSLPLHRSSTLSHEFDAFR
jgi:hypothetical protein